MRGSCRNLKIFLQILINYFKAYIKSFVPHAIFLIVLLKLVNVYLKTRAFSSVCCAEL